MVTFAKGFKATGIACGLKVNGKKDLAVIVSEKPAVAAGVYTRNIVKGHSLQLTMERMKVGGPIKAIIINSGCANACVGKKGYIDACTVTSYLAEKLNADCETVIMGSTGVIGQPLKIDKLKRGIDSAINNLSTDGGHDAEEAIMTTDTVPKEHSTEFNVGGKTVRLGGMAKGSGMIHPNMGTMISVITTDADITVELLDKALKKVTDLTFNRVSVDGDTSVCDMCIVLANKMAGNVCIDKEGEEYHTFIDALHEVCEKLAKDLARDGEGATKLLEINVVNCKSNEDAYKVACSIAKSPLCKTAFFGEDANWGRIITAAGYSGCIFNPDMTDIYIGDVMVCKNGYALPFNEEKALEILKKNEVKVLIDLHEGTEYSRMWTCDFSYDYVKINGSYRS